MPWKEKGAMKSSVGFLICSLAIIGFAACSEKTPARNDSDFQLDNGLTVILHPVKDARSVALLTLFSIGERHDPEDKAGMAHVIEHLYVTSAAGATTARTVEQYMARYPLGWNAQTGADYTVVATVFPRDRLDEELTDASHRLSDLYVRKEDLARELPRIRQELINMHRNVPMLAAQNAAYELIHGTKRGGDPDRIDTLTLSEIRRRVNTYYKPANAILVLAGDIEEAAAAALIEKKFAGIDSGEKIPDPPEKAASSRPGPVAVNLPSPSAQFSPHVAVAVEAPPPADPLFPAFLIAAARFYKNADRLGQTPDAFPVIYAPLDRPEILIVQRPVQARETGAVVEKRLRDFFVATISPELSDGDIPFAKQFFSHLLGFTDFPGTPQDGQLYGIAFRRGRFRQMGVDSGRLLEKLESTTGEEFAAMKAKYFSDSAR
jgi:zinc protease